MTERPATTALAAELCSVGLLHQAQGERCAVFVLERLGRYVKALEFYRDATGADFAEDRGARAAAALAGDVAVDAPEPRV